MAVTKQFIVAIVGMPGAGKTAAASVFATHGWHVIRFGQITLDEVLRRGWPVNEESERAIREEFRMLHGMAAYAVLNLSKIETLLATAPVAIDNLMSWSEYKVMKEKFGDRFLLVALYASPRTRSARLAGRAARHGADAEKKFRSFSPAETAARDAAEIEKLEKGGPIAMADYTIINEISLEDLRERVKEYIDSL